MSGPFSRILTFHSQDLGDEANLLLTFDSQNMPGIYDDYFPIAWRVATFGASSRFAMTCTYKSQLSFIQPQLVGDIIIGDSSWVNIDVGQQTSLFSSFNGSVSFSAPAAQRPPDPSTLQVWNRTTEPQTIGIGFDTGPLDPPTTALLFKPLPAGYNVTAQFTPILTAYVVTDSEEKQQNQIIRKAIQNPPLLRVNLTVLAATTSWTLSRNPSTGDFSLSLD